MSDLISRSALMREIGATVVFSGRNYPSAEIRGANKVIDRIKAAPAVDAVPVVHGRWMRIGEADYKCSICGFRFTSGEPISMFSHCRCGAKMDLGGEERTRRKVGAADIERYLDEYDCRDCIHAKECDHESRKDRVYDLRDGYGDCFRRKDNGNL